MMAAKGLAKLIEECGELIQAAGKRLAYYTTDTHPDGGPPLTKRLEEEIADVIAACNLVIKLNNLDERAVHSRALQKLDLFLKWHFEEETSYSIDAIQKRALELKTFVDKVELMARDLGKIVDPPKPAQETCYAALDGECNWKPCPQLRDNEPATSGRHCPLDVDRDD